MYSKRNIKIQLFALLAVLLFSLLATAQGKRVYIFKGVNIPLNLLCGDSEVEKGKFDLEIIRFRGQFYLKILKGRSQKCRILGENLVNPYSAISDIPAKPNLSMMKISQDKILKITFESGTMTGYYPKVKVTFDIEYE